VILDQGLFSAPEIDPKSVDLDGAERVTYVLEQSFRYDYSAPVEQLHHRLVVLPPERHGSQYLRAHRLDIEGAEARREVRRDWSGNTVFRFHADRVESAVEFKVGALVERVRSDGPVRLSADAADDPRFLSTSRLTSPDDRLRQLAADLVRGVTDRAEIGARLCVGVHGAMIYEYGITTIHTTAAEALAGGRGVCQDYAHIMLALCHLLKMPARYVSGHLLGQGGTHAWVELIVADSEGAVAMPFDPCNGVAATAGYLTVATGRDYADVRPTSGSYVGASGGRLTSHRRLAVLAAA
jgi:transglutaminase-like putative cysteine protease